MSYYPTPNEPKHKSLEELLENECIKRNITILNLPQYYDLDNKQKNSYSKCFSNECLFIRSHPDKILLGSDTIFIDCKTQQKKHDENIAIELSSFYWGIKYNIMVLKFFYLHYNSQGEPMVFTPINNEPHVFMIQPHWLNHPMADVFNKYVSEIKNNFENKKIKIKILETKGSRDPFVLKKLESLKELPLIPILDAMKP